jgi:hypothetical protein
MAASIRPARIAAGHVGWAVLLAAAGCGSPVAYTAVTGKVTLGGKPLAGVKVWFHPMTEGNRDLPYATAVTDSEGVYKLTSNNGKDGALVGKHRVVVNWPPRERTDDASRPPPVQRQPIPAPYTQATETPLIFEVKAGEPQTIDLPLQVQP